MNTTIPKPSPKLEIQSGFSGMGIAPKILESLARLKFTTPTPIQSKAIPLGIQGKDIVGIAQTGTGKTLAFAIPILQQLSKTKKQALIVLPTRELALQVDETFRKVGGWLGLRTAVLIGGASMWQQVKMMREVPHVIIGTPGRIIDHINQKVFKLNDIGMLVLDEADRMFDMGFAPQIKMILKDLPSERQTMLFSATMPADIAAIATRSMRSPERVEVARAGTLSQQVKQEFFLIRNDQKIRLLEKMLTDYKGTVLIFSRTKRGATKICRAVRALGHTGAEIHSDKSLYQRREALHGFKTGKYRVLVATDIASRGIDVTGIELIVNYDMPENPEDYVHRIGRTGRAGQEGHAVSFVTSEQRRKVFFIERLTRTRFQILQATNLPPDRFDMKAVPEKVVPQKLEGSVAAEKKVEKKPFEHKSPYHGRAEKTERSFGKKARDSYEKREGYSEKSGHGFAHKKPFNRSGSSRKFSHGKPAQRKRFFDARKVIGGDK